MKALIVVDAQNDFITGALKNEEAIFAMPILQKTVLWAVNNNYDIYYTMDTHDENYMNTQEGNFLPVPHCLFRTPGWNIAEEVSPENMRYENIYILRKSQFGTMKWQHLGMDKYDEIVIAGFCTDICVISNALILKSMYPNTPITVIMDACAGVTPDTHTAAIKVMRSCQINCLNWDELWMRK